MEDNILQKVTSAFSALSCIEGIVLGGSRATASFNQDSDIDIGLYYKPHCLDYDELNSIAKSLDDQHRNHSIGKEGDWGQWVNFGGWLQIDGKAVDLIFRDLGRVENVIDQTNAGIFSNNYHLGHPHAYLSFMYRGELAASKIQYAKDHSFRDLKALAQQYPDNLQASVIQFYLFEADFSLMLAKKAISSGDRYYLSGHIFRMVSALNQVIFAKNKVYFLNEKKAIQRIDRFEFAPSKYEERINEIFGRLYEQDSPSIGMLEVLLADVQNLISFY